MHEKREVPTVLAVVAALFFISGAGSVIDILIAMLSGHPSVNLGVLGIPICFGLRAFSRGWRTCALILLWLGVVGGVVAFLGGLFMRDPVTVNFFGRTVGHAPPIVVTVLALPLTALIAWQIYVLLRPEIRRMFYA